MRLRSKAQAKKWDELLRMGKISEKQYKEAVLGTDIRALPERVGPTIPLRKPLGRKV